MAEDIFRVRTHAEGPQGSLPITAQMLREEPSGNLFGLTQSAGMGWNPSELLRPAYLILSTQGGVRAADGRPIALGYHTGHWEVGLLVEEAAHTLRQCGAVPYAGHCSDPCDGRSQGTTGMFDSLPYRNDAAIIVRRLVRSLPTRQGVMGVATCDKGLPAMMMALAAMSDLPTVIVPGGVTLPPREGEDTAMVQTIGARFSHGLLSLQDAAEAGCRACASPGGGCQFLGTAATAQVVAEALGMALAHTALAPSGEPVWRDMAVRSARALMEQKSRGFFTRHYLSEASLRNAMTVHAAFGGSTNLLLHIPAIAHAAGLRRPTVADWRAINARTPRLVSVLPNGPVHHPTVQVFLAGGVPEVMLHLRGLNLLELDALTADGRTWRQVLEEWESSERRSRFRQILRDQAGVDADQVIHSPASAAQHGITPTLTFPTGNLAPEGSVIKSTSIDPSKLDAQGVYCHQGPARFFASERAAMAAIKNGDLRAGDVLVLAGIGPMGTGMEEIYQITSALKFLPFGKEVAVVTDGRFSGVSTGACVGHVGPEALAGGPIGRVREGDIIRIEIDCRRNLGSVNWIGDGSRTMSPEEGAAVLAQRPRHPSLAPHPQLPEDTRLWAALQAACGGTWGGCVYDAGEITARLGASKGA